MPSLPRRRFLYVMAGGGVSLAAAAPSLLSRFGRASRQTESDDISLQRVTRQSWALGSTVSITALHPTRAVAAAAVEAAFAELETVEQVMSIYRADSQLSRLNRAGVCRDAHPYLVEVLRAALAMSRRTRGAFDVTIQPLWEVYWRAHVQGTQPAADQIAAAGDRTDWRNVAVAGRTIRFQRPGTEITLNGIAQGYAADRATAALRRGGVQHALIDTGEFSSLGLGSDGDGWNVGIQHPRQNDAFVAIANLAGRCLATSGDYATKFDESFSAHHLLDPRTGRSAGELSSVSIVADTGLAADALSTATFVLGFQAGRELIAATPGADALLVTSDGRRWVSAGFPIQEKV